MAARAGEVAAMEFARRPAQPIDPLATSGDAPDASSVLEALPAAVLVVEPDGRVCLANARAAEILGRRPERGTPVEALLGPIETLRGATAAERPVLVPPHRAGATFGFSVAALPGPVSAAQLVVVFQDITPLERLREERDRLLRVAAVGEVLPAVLHEIKNPLAAVTTSVEVLLEELPEGHERRELTAVLGEVRRINLALEGIGIFRNELRTARRFAVDDALREAYIVAERQMRAKGIEGILRVPELPLLPFDPAVMRAILFNLVTNAIHACAAGQRISVSAAVVDGALEVRVADTGAGMTREVLARCRELFFTTKSNGTGLGLALCANVVTAAGGRLDIESEAGRGTEVTVRVAIEKGASS